MQTLTEQHAEILKSPHQAGDRGFRGIVEVDRVIPGGEVVLPDDDLILDFGTVTDGGGNRTVEDPHLINDGDDESAGNVDSFAGGTGTYTALMVVDLGEARVVESMTIVSKNYSAEGPIYPSPGQLWSSTNGVDWTLAPYTVTSDNPAAASRSLTLDTPTEARYFRAGHVHSHTGIQFVTGHRIYRWGAGGSSLSEVEETIETETLEADSIDTDKSLSLVAATATVVIPNPGRIHGWGSSSIIPCPAPIRIKQWYGDAENAIQTFFGYVDRRQDGRDVTTITLTCRDRMVLLADPEFSAFAPQFADEEGADRTTDNGVYLESEVSDIVYDIVVNRAGWPSDAVEITPTSMVLDEYIIPDGSTWADAIIGDEALTGITGYHAWADELGVFHFAPLPEMLSLTEPPDPDYEWATGVDVTRIADETHIDDLVTRVKVRGPYTTEQVRDVWTELWRTSKISKPAGLWYDPDDTTIIRVLDRGTKRLYRLRQSDRQILGSAYLGDVTAHPLGLSGDPDDTSIYWVLHAPWINTGTATNNKVKKFRKSDNVQLASYDIPDGRWSAIKVSTSWVYLTNLDTDRFYRRSKTDLSAVADYQHSWNGNPQSNPSGLMIDGTTLHVRWSEGSRFLVADESAPGTVTKRIRTAGSELVGGEMDTTTHTECFGGSDSLGIVMKATLVEIEEDVTDVAHEEINLDLEDELGTVMQTEPRTHDAHSGDDPHRWYSRRLTLSLPMISSLAQAADVARAALERLGRRGRDFDYDMIGHPGVQLLDLAHVTDPLTGVDVYGYVHTYRTSMEADGTYEGGISLTTVDVPDDEPEEDEAATEPE